MKSVEFVVADRKSRFVECTSNDKFMLRKDRPVVWLQKVCLFILRRLKAYAMDEQVTFEYRTINPKSFIDRLYAQKAELFKNFNEDATELLIGAEDYAKLMHEINVTHNVINFKAYYNYSKGGRVSVGGLTVTIIPWMRGMIVMPKGRGTK